MRAAGYPMGPFELMDLIGIDVNLAVAPRCTMRRSRPGIRSPNGSVRRRSRSASSRPDASAARPARASTNTRRPHDRPGDAARPTSTAAGRGRRADQIAIVDEAYRAFGDGVATASDIDLALRLGAGPPGGPFERASLVGGPAVVLERLGRFADRGPRFEPAPALVDAEHR